MLEQITIFCLITMLVIALAHRLVFRTRCAPTSGSRSRSYSALERLTHLGLAIGFLILAITGFIPVLTSTKLEDILLQLHFMGAGLFMVCLAITTLLWAADARFVPADWPWLKSGGGFLRPGGSILPPAPGARFDAGQKLFFWLESLFGLACMATALITMFPILSSVAIGACIVIHAYCSLLFILVVLMHFYVGCVVKPKAWKKILLGRSQLRQADSNPSKT